MEKSRRLIPVALIVAVAAVSTSSIFIRYAQSGGAPSLVIAALRLTFATLILAPVAFARHWDEIRRFTRTEILLGIVSGVFLAAHFAAWITSLEYTSVASSVVFVGTGPLWVALLSPLLLKERVSRVAMIGLGVAVVGGIIIGLGDACVWNRGLICSPLSEALKERAMWGNFLALVGAWAVTGYLVIGRKLRGGTALVPYIFLVYGVSAVVLLLLMALSGASPFGYGAKTYLWVFLLAAIPQVIGHSVYNWALKYLAATLVAVSVLGEPIGSAILAFFLLHETPSPMTLFGGLLILLGIYFASKK
ncbi:MAG: DMT family transporter [Anaerolineales bacterium]|nr:DMT family transporter [Anaerolineales bacterium]